MLARFEKYSDSEVTLIGNFLTDSAREMREEAMSLPKAASTLRTRRANSGGRE